MKKIIIFIITIIVIFLLKADNNLYYNNVLESFKSDKFKNTDFTTSFDTAISPQKNLIYCSFIPLTIKNLSSDKSIETTSVIIKSDYNTILTDETLVNQPKDNTFTIFGKINDHFPEKLHKIIKNKLSKSDAENLDIFSKNYSHVIINYFNPIIEFKNSFETHKILNYFNERPVKCFGTENVPNRKLVFKKQVKILYDFRPDILQKIFKNTNSKNNLIKLPIGFILQLITNTDIELIISTIPPKNNLFNSYLEINNLSFAPENHHKHELSHFI